MSLQRMVINIDSGILFSEYRMSGLLSLASVTIIADGYNFYTVYVYALNDAKR